MRAYADRRQKGKGKGKGREARHCVEPPSDWPETLPFHLPERDIRIEHDVYQLLSKQIPKAWKNGHPSVLHRLRHCEDYRQWFVGRFGVEILENLPSVFRMPVWTNLREYRAHMDSHGRDPVTGHTYEDLDRYEAGDRRGIETLDMKTVVHPWYPDEHDYPPGYAPKCLTNIPGVTVQSPAEYAKGKIPSGKGRQPNIPPAAAKGGSGRSAPYHRVHLTPAPTQPARKGPQEREQEH